MGPPVLLLHGLVGSGRYWGGAYNGLGDAHRLVVPDLLGFGRSPRPTIGYGPDAHVATVVQCLDELAIHEPLMIGAHSLGSLVAFRLAATHPERVAGIVAFGPPLYPDATTARRRIAASSPMARLVLVPGRGAELACAWMCDHRRLAAFLAAATHPGLPAAIAADAVEHSWASYSQTLDAVILSARADAWLDEVRCPVRLVAGYRDPVVDHAHLRDLAATHANVEVHERSGRHNLPLTDPGACLGAILLAGRGTRRWDDVPTTAAAAAPMRSPETWTGDPRWL